MEVLKLEQRSTANLIEKAVANYNKLALPKRTRAVAEGRLHLLRERWESYQKLDAQIQVAAITAGKSAEAAVRQEEYDRVEEAFDEAYDFFQEKIACFTPIVQPVGNSTIKLPTIELPKFSGSYTDWTNYKSMFDTMIIQNKGLNDVQRLHYLKSTLSGEAARLLQHFSVTEENFNTAWTTLTEAYEDKRAIIDAHFQNFLSLPVVTTENAKDLKNLRDRTKEALKALDNLECETDKWDPLIVYLTVQKLDPTAAREWEMQLGATSTYPTFKALTDFLSSRVRALEKIQGNNKPTNRSNVKSKTSNPATELRALSTTTGASGCFLCDENHALYKCDQFKAQALKRRKEIVREKDCCFNCLRPGHRPRACPSKYSCALCKKKHHTLLHPETNSANSETTNSSRPVNTDPAAVATPPLANVANVSTHRAQNLKMEKQFTLLATAMVTIRSATGRRLRVRALLDQGSQSTLIKESIVQILRPKRFPANALVNGVGEVEIGTARHRVNVFVEAQDSEKDTVALSALVMPTLTRYVPRSCPQLLSWSHLAGLALADPQPSSKEPIDLIIGADYYGALLRPGLRQGPASAPTAQATIFGWILSGPVSSASKPPDNINVHNCITSEDLQNSLARFWELEELPRTMQLSEDEQKCEEHFKATHRRDDSGKYVVRLPFKSGPPITIGNSFFRARSMLNTVERKILRDSGLNSAYHAFLSEYEASNHMREALSSVGSETTSPLVYLPHHPVIRESSSTTRVRVVFNASSVTSNSTSLNDHLLVGPKLQTDITTIITLWRVHRFAYTADTEKMFRQILVDLRDVDYQRILWRRENEKNVTQFQLLTVTYGTACAPFLANRVLHQLADDEGEQFPLAKRILKENFYVDDALFGADTIEAAQQTRDELTRLLACGGFHLRKLAANAEELLADCPRGEHELAAEVPFEDLN